MTGFLRSAALACLLALPLAAQADAPRDPAMVEAGWHRAPPGGPYHFHGGWQRPPPPRHWGGPPSWHRHPAPPAYGRGWSPPPRSRYRWR